MKRTPPNIPDDGRFHSLVRRGLVLWLVVVAAAGCGPSRTLVVTSEPAGAAVYINGVDRGRTPMERNLSWSKRPESKAHTHTVTIRAQNYADWERKLTYADARGQWSRWRLDARLERLVHRIEVMIDTEPPGGTVRLGSGSVFATPARVPITFSRESVSAPWSVPAVSVTMGEDYAPRLLELEYERVARNPHVLVSMPRLRQRVLVDITSNIEGVRISIDDREIGTTPLKHHFTFTRDSAEDSWNTFVVSAEKEHHRYRPPGASGEPYEITHYTASIGLQHVASGRLHVELEPVQFYRTPVTRFVVNENGLDLLELVKGSQIDDVESEPAAYALTRVPSPPTSGASSETRLAVMADNHTIVYSSPVHSSGNPNRSAANLFMQRGHEVTRLTDGHQIDIEPAISPDGQWIYFASDRLRPGKLNLWRIRTTGRGGLTKVTDSASSIADTEPSISTKGNRIAFTTYLEGASAPQIWTANADGTLPTQLRTGRHPAWSPDGSKIAYVAPDVGGAEQVWVMTADGGSPTQLTSGPYDHHHPAWTPDGRKIVYASNQAVNEAGVQKFDIWIMNTDGSDKTQLTVNGSYDNRPSVSPDGRYVYFISNRGAKRDLDDSAVRIWRIQIEPG